MSFRYGAFAALLAMLPLSAPADETRRIDPDAVDIALEAAAFLVSQEAMAFDWFVSHDEVIEGREKITFVRSGSNVMVRGQGFHTHAERADGVREYYYDGQTFTIAAPEEGFYSSAPFDQGFEALLVAARERTGTQVPVWTLMSATLGENALEQIEGAAYLGTTRIGGEEAHHLAFTEYDEDWQLWVSTDPDMPVPLMLVSTDPYQQGWPQYRAHFYNWDLAPEVAEGAFTYVPHEDDVKAAMPSLVKTDRERALEAAGAALGAPQGEDAQ